MKKDNVRLLLVPRPISVAEAQAIRDDECEAFEEDIVETVKLLANLRKTPLLTERWAQIEVCPGEEGYEKAFDPEGRDLTQPWA